MSSGLGMSALGLGAAFDAQLMFRPLRVGMRYPQTSHNAHKHYALSTSPS